MKKPTKTKKRNEKKMNLTILSYGGGQDSKAILAMLVNDPKVRAQYAPDRLAVVMSDTGDEHDYTYNDLKEVREVCAKANIEFHFLTSDMGFHTASWPDLITPQLRGTDEKYKATMVQMGTKSCTANLKLKPIYKWLDEYVNTLGGYNFNVSANRGCLKKAMKQWHKDHGKITMLIGFAAGEEKRSDSAMKLEAKEQASESDIWEKGITRKFPLIDHGMNRQAAQQYILANGYNCPPPSNCMRCPYMGLAEILWLFKNAPEKFAEWELIEANKLARDTSEKNHGVYNSKKTLGMKLIEAQEKFGNLSDAELNAHKFSHGCTKNSM